MRFFLSSHGASLFGAERVLLATAAGLLARGHAVTLELPHDGLAHSAARDMGLRVLISGRSRLPRNAAELVRYIATFPGSVRRARTALRAAEYDVVWINSIYNPPASLAPRRKEAAVVWHLHERNFHGAAGSLAAHWIRTHCDLALAPSNFVAHTFAAAGLHAPHLRVLPNALLRPITAVPLRPRGDSLVVGYVGQLEPRKRTVDLMEALTHVDGATALLVGDGKARSDVESAVARLHLTGRVRLAGYQEDVLPFLEECDCIVIPSPDEAFGLVALEAMAAGRSVIAAHSGALPEVLGHAALYFPLGDVKALARRILQLRQDPGLATELRGRGLARVREYSMDRMLDGVEAAAVEAIARRRGTRSIEAVA
jgi:glycosyltransferase involved in cell wall biosynthesis